MECHVWKGGLLGNEVEPQDFVVGKGLEPGTSSDTGLLPSGSSSFLYWFVFIFLDLFLNLNQNVSLIFYVEVLPSGQHKNIRKGDASWELRLYRSLLKIFVKG